MAREDELLDALHEAVTDYEAAKVAGAGLDEAFKRKSIAEAAALAEIGGEYWKKYKAKYP